MKTDGGEPYSIIAGLDAAVVREKFKLEGVVTHFGVDWYLWRGNLGHQYVIQRDGLRLMMLGAGHL